MAAALRHTAIVDHVGKRDPQLLPSINFMTGTMGCSEARHQLGKEGEPGSAQDHHQELAGPQYAIVMHVEPQGRTR